MILNYDYIEIWDIDKISKIPKHLNMGIGKIVQEHHADKNIKQNSYNLEVSWRNLYKGKVKTPAIKTLYTLTDVFVYIYGKYNIAPLKGRIKIVNPKTYLHEIKSRDIIAKEFQADYPHHSMHTCISVFTGGLQPKLDLLIDLTNFLEKHELEILDLPKDKGKRWDLDEWIKNSDIKRKQSWEQQYD
tara:strand:+ start:378 stop:938 length:561 start_codon:yes stop_codon:yes gene_type:complete